MPLSLYEIVFAGEVIPGAQLQLVKNNLAKLFQADDQRIALLFSGRRLVLKSNLEAAAAEKYRATLERAGAKAQVVEMAVEIEEIEMAPPPDEPGFVRCPAAKTPAKVVPRDVYMAAFVDVDAPDFVIAEVGRDLQDAKPAPRPPVLDLRPYSLAPVGADLGQAKAPQAPAPPDTSHLNIIR
jgi:hypothetical protein